MKTQSAHTMTFFRLAGMALAALSAGAAQASVVINLPTTLATGSIQFTNNISFTVTTAGSLAVLVFDEWVTSDGSQSFFSGSYITPGELTYSLNGGAPVTTNFSTTDAFADNIAKSFGPMTANDGYMRVADVPVAVNDVITIQAASYTLAAGSLPANFNPQAAQTFSGNAFLMSIGGTRLSADTSTSAVPEPGTAGLAAFAALGLLRRRRHA